MSTTDSTATSRPSSIVSDASSSMAPEKEKAPDEASKFRLFLNIVKRFFGVTDLASVRFSLPAELLEPRPNLDYWMYLDRPETFTAIGDSDDELGRMLAALRFWFTKDLKYVRGKPCKPYNSVLGEFFRCRYDVENNLPVILDRKKGDTAASKPKEEQDQKVQVIYLTEQTSHHPPISAWVAECPEKGITARGYDQLSGKFLGTSIRVTPGAYNLGIFVTLDKRDGEEYQMTHPAAFLGGFLRGNLSVSVADQCSVRCPKTRLKTILHYESESWYSKTQNKVRGVIFRYDPDNDTIEDIKNVPAGDILARLEGNWKESVHFTLAGEKEEQALIDLTLLEVAKKELPPDTEQLPNESFRFWAKLTEAITSKQFGDANKIKQELEENQRTKAAERQKEHEKSKANGGEDKVWKPNFFAQATSPDGKPTLSSKGEAAMKGIREKSYKLDKSEIIAA